MVVKRALVVDDSKSARAFLSRLLIEQQVEVDAAESAEQAIEYLTKHAPDVIFMDHLMPGMDGFQAVQAIKANPRTATIPILMYTSQEGELYLGQARALGAVGVMPKSVSPADVRMVLQQLQLPEPPVLPVAVPKETHDTPATAALVRTASLPELNPAVEELKEELAALRRHLIEALDARDQHVAREIGTLVREAVTSAAARAEPPIVLPEKPRHSPVPWLLALAASAAAAVVGTLWWQGQQRLDAVNAELMDSRSTVAMLTARLAPASADAGAVAALPAEPALVVKVPFGEAPLSGARVAALRDFVARVAELGQKGTVEVRSYAGRFCLAGSAAAGYALADGATPAGKCDLVAEATDPALGNAAAESAGFASALTELRKRHASLLTIDVAVASGEAPGYAYPESGAPTAGEWNAVATGNNRVEIRWRPAT